MTRHQQWRAARRPVVIRLWRLRKALNASLPEYMLFHGMWKLIYQLCREASGPLAMPEVEEFRLALKLLKSAKQAERQGQDPVLWALTHK